MALMSNHSEQKQHRYIVVEGPIGVGKTTLAKRLADTFEYSTLLEAPEANPFLPRFYQNQRDNALATQLFFLFQRCEQHKILQQSDLFSPAFISDYLFEKDRLFVRINLDEDEFKLYDNIQQQLEIKPSSPDLVIYLQAPSDILMQRIAHRGIAEEQDIERDYLEALNEAYSQFFLYYDQAPLLIVNAAQIDLANNDQDYAQFIDYLQSFQSGRHFYNPTFFS
jgi:deoxyadenosine/deoxycytidine kinase